MTSETREARYSRGLELLRRIGGAYFDNPVVDLSEIFADFTRHTVEFPYGDVLSRPGLDIPVRQLCTVSMLLANGNAQAQLRFHISGFLNAGGKPDEIVELLFLSTAILGFPTTVNAIGLVRSIFAERDLEFLPIEPETGDGTGRGSSGRQMLERVLAGDAESYFKRFSDAAPDLAQLSIEFEFGDALSRAGLDHKVKLLAVIGMLSASGNRADALRLHLEGALANGVTREEIIELFIQLSVYCGFPAAVNAMAVAQSVFADGARPLRFDYPVRDKSESRTDRLERGSTLLAKSSAASGDAVVRSFEDIAPDLGRMIVEHSYGEVFSRGGIDLKTRELSACAALAAIGSATMETPLRVHINAALNVGAGQDEIVETLLNLAPYVGYPAVQQAIGIAAEEFARSERSPQ
ncbi:MAG: carboxymuconolactone decarboxylase family protein [Pseudomonadota bacterium]|nr:carboxymuconolactone decarboxylase family protein [Pseudomonadota bacterium]